TLLNLNDCEANSNDCKIFSRDLGKVDLLLNQFSLAGYRGQYDYETHLKKNATAILENMVENHRDLNAGVTIPIASFVYFSDEDNRYVNRFMNSPMQVKKHFDSLGLQMAVLYPGDTYDSNLPYDSQPA